MPSESRVKRWRDNKRQQGLKHVSVWLTDEEELRLKDLAMQWHCSPSQVVQRALAQIGTIHTLEHGSPIDTSLIRELVREELAAMQVAQRQATGGNSGGPTDTQTAGKLSTRPAPGQTKLTPLQAAEMRGKRAEDQDTSERRQPKRQPRQTPVG